MVFVLLWLAYFTLGFLGGSDSNESICNVGDLVQSLGREDPLEKGMVTHSSTLAWRVPQTEDPGGLLSTESNKESDVTKRLTLTISHSVGLKSSLMLQHVSECSSFLRWTNIPLYASATFCISVRLLMDAWVASTFAVVNNAAVNTSVHIPVWIPDVTSRGYIPRSERLLLFFFFFKDTCAFTRYIQKAQKYIQWKFFLPLLSSVTQFQFINIFCRLCFWYLEKAMAPHSSTLAWKIPWTEEPGRL